MEQYERLRQYNRWRRGEDDWAADGRGPDPKELGELIDGVADRLDTDRAAAFARADGFSCVSAMLRWFRDQYMSCDFEGYYVRWHVGSNAGVTGLAPAQEDK